MSGYPDADMTDLSPPQAPATTNGEPARNESVGQEGTDREGKDNNTHKFQTTQANQVVQINMNALQNFDGDGIVKSLEPFQKPQTNPVVVYVNLLQMVAKPEAFVDNEAGKLACTSLHATNRMWTSMISQFKESLTAQQFNFEELLQALGDLKVRLDFVESSKRPFTKELIDNQLGRLRERVKEYKANVKKLSELHSLSTWYYRRHEDEEGATEKQLEFAKTAQDLDKQLQGLKAFASQEFDGTVLKNAITKQKEELAVAEEDLKNRLSQEGKQRNKVSELSAKKERLEIENAEMEETIAEMKQNIQAHERQKQEWTDAADKAVHMQNEANFDKLTADGVKQINDYWEPIAKELEAKQAALIKSTSGGGIVKSHTVFVCDSSWSMSDGDYDKMMDSVCASVQARAGSEDSALDEYSVVLFSNCVSIVCESIKVKGGFSKPKRIGGGTDFTKAFAAALKVAQNNQSPNQVVVFMTDGEASTRGISKMFQEGNFARWRNTLESFRVFTVGYGTDTYHNQLKDIAEAGNNGKSQVLVGGKMINYIYEATDADSLHKCYQQINQNMNLEQALKKKELNEVQQRLQKAKQEQEGAIEANAERIKKLWTTGQTNMKERRKVFEEQADEIRVKAEEIKAAKIPKQKMLENLRNSLSTTNSDIQSVSVELEREQRERSDKEATVNKRKQNLETLEQQLKTADETQLQAQLQGEILKPVYTQNRTLVNDSELLREIQEKLTHMIQKFSLHGRMLTQSLDSATDYIEDEMHVDSDSAFNLCLQRLAEDWSIAYSEADFNIRLPEFMKRLVQTIGAKERNGCVEGGDTVSSSCSPLDLAAEHFNLGGHLHLVMDNKLLTDNDRVFKAQKKKLTDSFSERLEEIFTGSLKDEHEAEETALNSAIETARGVVELAKDKLSVAEHQDPVSKEEVRKLKDEIKQKEITVKELERNLARWKKDTEKAFQKQLAKCEDKAAQAQGRVMDLLDTLEKMLTDAFNTAKVEAMRKDMCAFCLTSCTRIQSLRSLIPPILDLCNNPAQHKHLVEHQRTSFSG